MTKFYPSNSGIKCSGIKCSGIKRPSIKYPSIKYSDIKCSNIKYFINISLHLFFTLSLIIIFTVLLKHSVHADHSLIHKTHLNQIKYQYSIETVQRFTSWDQLLADSQDKTIEDKLLLVNQFFNKMKWVNDSNLWHQRDYWATPIESLLRNAGDCEDFSIAKYFTLKALGVPNNALKITYVTIINNNQSHMVLAYYKTPQADPLILDNVNKDIVYYSKRTDLKIKFSFNDQKLWLAQNTPQITTDSQQIRIWANLIKRMKSEQI
jgi:predicted transglutaminase-like cysteine proteinase